MLFRSFADELFEGLRVRATPNGTKSFSVVRWRGGRQQRITIGPYPLVSLAEARARAREVLLANAATFDPPEEVAPAEPSLTYKELANLYVERHLKPNTRSWRDALIAAGTPFLLATGYSDNGDRTDLATLPVLRKPYRPDQLTAQLSLLLNKASANAP